jgi:hypothetical protein
MWGKFSNSKNGTLLLLERTLTRHLANISNNSNFGINLMDLGLFVLDFDTLTSRGLVCEICQKVSVNPQYVCAEAARKVNACGHNICEGCLRTHSAKGNCPIHKDRPITAIIENLDAARQIYALEVKCPRFDEGCRMTSFNAQVNVNLEWFQLHKSQCDFEPKQCRTCKKSFLQIDHKYHEESCDEALIDCPYSFSGCNCAPLKKKDMKSYLARTVEKHLSSVTNAFLREMDIHNPAAGAEIRKQFELVNSMSDANFRDSEEASQQWRYKLKKGSRVDAKDYFWYSGIVRDKRLGEVFIHFVGQSEEFDSWIPLDSEKLAVAGSQTGMLPANLGLAIGQVVPKEPPIPKVPSNKGKMTYAQSSKQRGTVAVPTNPPPPIPPITKELLHQPEEKNVMEPAEDMPAEEDDELVEDLEPEADDMEAPAPDNEKQVENAGRRRLSTESFETGTIALSHEEEQKAMPPARQAPSIAIAPSKLPPSKKPVDISAMRPSEHAAPKVTIARDTSPPTAKASNAVSPNMRSPGPSQVPMTTSIPTVKGSNNRVAPKTSANPKPPIEESKENVRVATAVKNQSPAKVPNSAPAAQTVLPKGSVSIPRKPAPANPLMMQSMGQAPRPTGAARPTVKESVVAPPAYNAQAKPSGAAKPSVVQPASKTSVQAPVPARAAASKARVVGGKAVITPMMKREVLEDEE